MEPSVRRVHNAQTIVSNKTVLAVQDCQASDRLQFCNDSVFRTSNYTNEYADTLSSLDRAPDPDWKAFLVDHFQRGGAALKWEGGDPSKIVDAERLRELHEFIEEYGGVEKATTQLTADCKFALENLGDFNSEAMLINWKRDDCDLPDGIDAAKRRAFDKIERCLDLDEIGRAQGIELLPERFRNELVRYWSRGDDKQSLACCSECGKALVNGTGFESDGTRWHIDCLRCLACDTPFEEGKIEQISTRAREEKKEPNDYLPRRVDQTLLAISGRAGRVMAGAEEVASNIASYTQFSARRAK